MPIDKRIFETSMRRAIEQAESRTKNNPEEFFDKVKAVLRENGVNPQNRVSNLKDMQTGKRVDETIEELIRGLEKAARQGIMPDRILMKFPETLHDELERQVEQVIRRSGGHSKNVSRSKQENLLDE